MNKLYNISNINTKIYNNDGNVQKIIMFQFKWRKNKNQNLILGRNT